MDIAIVAIGYNRPESMKRLFSSLSAAEYGEENVTLYISLDKGERQAELIKDAEAFSWTHGKKIIRAFPERQGLKKHVLQCGDLVENHDAVIALEDDITVSPYFYGYAKQAVEFYNDDERVAGISLYKYNFQHYTGRAFEPTFSGFDCFFMRVASSWGQCWTKNQWRAFRAWQSEHDEKLFSTPLVPKQVFSWNEGSWLKYYMYYVVFKKKYFVFPYFSLSTCHSDEGAHTEKGEPHDKHQTSMCFGDMRYRFPMVGEGVLYDAFFERELETPPAQIKSGKTYVMDLYGAKENISDYDYAFSSKLLDYKIISSFGYSLRPIESNVLFSSEGNDIFLYDMRSPEIHKYSRKERLIHEMRPYAYDIKYEYGPKRSLKLAIAFMLELKSKKNKK